MTVHIGVFLIVDINIVLNIVVLVIVKVHQLIQIVIIYITIKIIQQWFMQLLESVCLQV
jgi:hypothetical protein